MDGMTWFLRARFPRRMLRHLPGSLLGRLSLAFAVIGGTSLAIGVGVLHRTLDDVVWRTHVAAVTASSTAIADRLQARGATGLVAGLPMETMRRFDAATGSMRFAVLAPDGQVLVASPGAQPALPRLDTMGDAEEVFRLGADGSELWGISRQVATPQGDVTLQVAQDMGRAYVVLDDVVRGSIGPVVWVLAAGAVLLFVVNVGSVLLLLRPLRRAAGEAARIRPGGARRLAVCLLLKRRHRKYRCPERLPVVIVPEAD
jgi:hypothetical protein